LFGLERPLFLLRRGQCAGGKTKNAALTVADRTVHVIYYNPVVGHRFDASPLLRRHFAATLTYAAEEIGYGPDTEDPIVIWQGGIALGPIDACANARIEITDPRNRVENGCNVGHCHNPQPQCLGPTCLGRTSISMGHRPLRLSR